jgi:hypothetical protein
MHRVRVIPIAAVLLAGFSLSACSGMSNFSGSNFDPTDWITGDFFSTKEKLPGERKAVFPDGVPGVPEGVPKELIKGNQQAAIDATATPEPAPAPAAKPAPRPQAARPAPKPRTASAPPPAPARTAPPEAPQAQSATQWPDPNAARAPQPARTAPPAASNAEANWPPPNPNTFSR